MSKLIDSKVLKRVIDLAGKDRDDFKNTLVDLFQKRSEELVTELDQAITVRSSEKVKSIAHSLKSTVGCIGATTLVDQCSELGEIFSADDDHRAFELASALVLDLKQNCTDALEELKMFN